MSAIVTLPAEMTLRAVLRRRITVAILVLMPVAFYFATHDTVGRSVRSLLFGLSWAISTVAFFAAVAGRELEPRLELAGWRWRDLLAGRILGLAAVGLGLTALFGGLVAVDHDVRSIGAVVASFAVTTAVAIALGSTVGAVLRREMEGTLILFFLAGLQAIVNPFETYARALPFWSSRELGTYAVDGPGQGSLGDGLLHATLVIVLCIGIVATPGAAVVGRVVCENDGARLTLRDRQRRTGEPVDPRRRRSSDDPACDDEAVAMRLKVFSVKSRNGRTRFDKLEADVNAWLERPSPTWR